MTNIIKHTIKIRPEIEEVINAIRHDIQEADGFSLLVGGCVRDSLMGLEAKDIDIEVYYTQADMLQTILENYGTVKLTGKNFGVYKLFLHHEKETIDVSLARRENRIGKSHSSFKIDCDVGITPEEAALRRDFTINAFAYNIANHTVYDYFDGMKDLQSHRLRAVSDAFNEDPLRVLRGMRFAARFEMVMDMDTIIRSLSLKDEFSTISKERIWNEFSGMFLSAKRPSKGIKLLKQTGWIDNLPAIKNLLYVPQEPEYHPEGDVYTHTLISMDIAAEIAERENLNREERVVLILAMLCHDMGKPETTAFTNGRITSHGHDKKGVDVAREFMKTIGTPDYLVQQVLPLVREHMVTVQGPLTRKAIVRLAARIKPSSIVMLEHVIEADSSARPPLKPGRPGLGLVQMASELACEKEPMKLLLRGQDLLARGVKPSKAFGEILSASMRAQEEQIITDQESALAWLDSYLEKERVEENILVNTASLS